MIYALLVLCSKVLFHTKCKSVKNDYGKKRMHRFRGGSGFYLLRLSDFIESRPADDANRKKYPASALGTCDGK
jgi:hypothetical protein